MNNKCVCGCCEESCTRTPNVVCDGRQNGTRWAIRKHRESAGSALEPSFVIATDDKKTLLWSFFGLGSSPQSVSGGRSLACINEVVQKA